MLYNVVRLYQVLLDHVRLYQTISVISGYTFAMYSTVLLLRYLFSLHPNILHYIFSLYPALSGYLLTLYQIRLNNQSAVLTRYVRLYITLQRVTLDYIRPYRVISNYIELSLTISGYLKPYHAG